MLRAVQTAQKIGDMINLEPQIIIELHEKCRIHTVAPRKRIEGAKKSENFKTLPNFAENCDRRGMAVSSISQQKIQFLGCLQIEIMHVLIRIIVVPVQLKFRRR